LSWTNSSWRSSALTLVLLVLLAACTPLQPQERSADPVAARSNDVFWQSLQPGFEGDWHVLLNRGLDALDWRLLAIDSARDSIDIQTFLLEPDALGAAVLEHLIAAAERGVRVRFLIDDSFLQGRDELIMFVHRHDNMEFRVFNPYQRRTSNVFTRQILNLAEFSRLDHRMHNKAMIVDGQVAIVGGRNLADEYFGLHAEANFRDLELLVGGPIVDDISRAFAQYWNDPWSVAIDSLSHVTPEHVSREQLAQTAAEVAVLHAERDDAALRSAWTAATAFALPGRSRLLIDRPPEDNPALVKEAPVLVAHELMALIDSAKEEIVVISAYLIPTPVLEDAVRRAEERGVEVRLLTNSIRSNNHLTAHSAYRNHIEALMSHGASLYEVRVDAEDRPFYIRTPIAEKHLALHAKALIVDHDRVFIGSANLDPRSLRINTEMGLWVESRELNASLRSAVERDFADGNAWRLQFDEAGRVNWVSRNDVLTLQPAASTLQQIEDWFFAHLPIEDEL
jgi:putative cardiolipin synthase